MKKTCFYTEVAYVLGLILLAAGTALTAYGGLGLSMVVAPAYVLHVFVSQFLPFFSFGMAEYTLQAVVLIVMMIILRKVRLMYFLSFVAAVFYAFALDGAMSLTSLLPENTVMQIVMYVLGEFICCGAIALLFVSYLPPEAYEMFVKEIAYKFNKPVHKIKIFYDYGSLAVAVILSLVLLGRFEGIGIGTVVCAILYGFIIRMFQKLYEKAFRFEDGFKWRKYFEKGEK